MMQQSWVHVPAQSDFSLINIPFGIITYPDVTSPRPAVAIGEHALDLAIFSSNDGFSGLPDFTEHLHLFHEQTLNSFAALGRSWHAKVRSYLRDVLSTDTSYGRCLRDNDELRAKCLIPLTQVAMHLPLRIGDYTDFYAGKHHAYNAGVLFRGPENALQPNYLHLPVGYHGRASSIVVSGTPVRRPWGQILDESKQPVFHPSKKLDIELELGAFLCNGNDLGSPIGIGETEEHIFGYVLLNDWSARDIQSWEYVPLGPFNGKNFTSTISPWVVLSDALEPFRTKGIDNETPLQPHLRERRQDAALDIALEVQLTPAGSTEYSTITKTNSRYLLWSFGQMLAHHAVGGCQMNTGDLLGSGTISGLDRDSLGSLLEMTDGGKNSITVGGESRTFLVDGDEIVMRGHCEDAQGQRVGFGDCRGVIVEAWNVSKVAPSH